MFLKSIIFKNQIKKKYEFLYENECIYIFKCKFKGGGPILDSYYSGSTVFYS